MKSIAFILLIFLLSGCGRDTSSPKSGILGHWETENADLYFSSNKLTSVLKKDGTTREVEYTVISYNDKKRSILIKPNPKNANGENVFAEQIKFNEDYTKAELTLNLKNSDFSEEDKDTFENIDQEYMDTQVNKMKYIDSKQEIN